MSTELRAEAFELSVGKQFASYDDLKKVIKSYEDKTKQKLTTYSSKTIKAAKIKRYLNERLVYHNITYVCIHGGGDFKSKGEGIRKSSTYRTGCPFKVRLRASTDGNYLEVIAICSNHEGHELTEKVYEHLPQVRHLNTKEINEIETYFEVGANTKMVQNKIILDKGKKVTLKDLNNLKFKLKQDTNDLSLAVQLLKEDYKADVAILRDGDGNFKAMYFSTENMRKSMAAFPEIVFIDGTYKLINNGLTLMLLIVEDANGLSEVVGVCLIHNEDYETFKWFLTKFKETNQIASNSVQCFMGDKDLLERDVLKEIFVGVPTYICLFHTLKTFKRQITIEKFKINKLERETCLELLTKLAYSNSEQNYDEFYRIFKDTCPSDVVNYFDKNWHNIRSEWTSYNMIHGNLRNKTNNRLESLNQKIKAVVPLNSSLCSFVKYFFNWLNSHNEERNTKVAQMILKKTVTKFDKDSCEKKYMDFLTPFASSYVIAQCNLSKNVSIIEDIDGTYKVKSNNVYFILNTTKCGCADFSSMLLPCRHLLALRRYLNLPLFCEEACNRRWARTFYLKNHRTLLGPTQAENVSLSCTVTNSERPMVLNPSEKRKRANLIANSLINLTCLSSSSQFQYKLDCLKKIECLWRQGFEVTISKLGDETNEENSNINIGENESRYEDGILNEENSNIGFPDTGGNESCYEDDIMNEQNSNIDIENNMNGEKEIRNQEEENDDEIDVEYKFRDDKHESSKQDETDTIERNNTDLSSIVPHKIKRKGRPKGSELTVIGLKKRRNINIPIRYQLKAEKMKQIQILKTVLADPNIITQCLNDEYKIQPMDLISNIQDISHSLLDPEIDLNIIGTFLEPPAFRHLTEVIEEKKQNHE